MREKTQRLILVWPKTPRPASSPQGKAPWDFH